VNHFEFEIFPRSTRFPFQSTRFDLRNRGSPATIENRLRYFVGESMEETRMKKALAILATVATVGATAVTAPAEARGRGFGPGLAFGLAAGALTAGAIAGAYGPYYYGPSYGYYGYPAYYDYGPGPYAYYGGPTIIGTATGAIIITGNRKARNKPPGFLYWR
jgi:hypothetical protein